MQLAMAGFHWQKSNRLHVLFLSVFSYPASSPFVTAVGASTLVSTAVGTCPVSVQCSVETGALITSDKHNNHARRVVAMDGKARRGADGTGDFGATCVLARLIVVLVVVVFVIHQGWRWILAGGADAVIPEGGCQRVAERLVRQAEGRVQQLQPRSISL
jgi:hypothetical protein